MDKLEEYRETIFEPLARLRDNVNRYKNIAMWILILYIVLFIGSFVMQIMILRK